MTIEFDQKGGEALVFSRQAIMAATDEILTDNGVRAQGLAGHVGGVAGEGSELIGRNRGAGRRERRRESLAASPPAWLQYR